MKKMITKQCYFREKGSDTMMGGIYVEDGDERFIICGCCGRIIDSDDIANDIEEFRTFDTWVDINEEIRGED